MSSVQRFAQRKPCLTTYWYQSNVTPKNRSETWTRAKPCYIWLLKRNCKRMWSPQDVNWPLSGTFTFCKKNLTFPSEITFLEGNKLLKKRISTETKRWVPGETSDELWVNFRNNNANIFTEICPDTIRCEKRTVFPRTKLDENCALRGC